MNPSKGIHQMNIVCWHSRTGCCWIISIMLNGSSGRGWRCDWRNAQEKFGMWGTREGEERSEWRWNWESACSKTATSHLPESPNTRFMVVICWVPNGKAIVLSPKQLRFSYSDVRHWEELVDFIHLNGGWKEPYILTLMFKCTLEQHYLDEDYIGIYAHREMMNDPIYGQISYN